MKRRNFAAMALRSPLFARKVVKSKKTYNRKKDKAALRKEG
jgi:hypothetical protein